MNFVWCQLRRAFDARHRYCVCESEWAARRWWAQGSGGFLNAWIDLNIDGDWNDPGEQILTDVEMSSESKRLDFVVPEWQVGFSRFGKSYARFRISSEAGLSYAGPAADGEVEDLTLRVYMTE